jgi:hypothetical protein
VSFKHALVVLTSNVGSAAIAKGGSGLGFQLGGATEAAEAGYLRTRSLVMEELKVGGMVEGQGAFTFYRPVHALAGRGGAHGGQGLCLS